MVTLLAATASLAQEPVTEGDDATELAKKLQNRVAALISVPFQNNFDWGLGQRSRGSNTPSTFSR